MVNGSSRVKWSNHALYDVDIQTSIPLIEPIYDLARGMEDYFNPTKAEAVQMFETGMRQIERWGKTSFFRIWVGWVDSETTNNDSTGMRQYLCGVAIGRVNDLRRTTFEYRGWGLHAQAMRKVDEKERIGLVHAELENTRHIKVAATIGAAAIGNLLGALLDRPHEYRLSKGARTPRERMLNEPSVVTISLSKPIIHTVGKQGGGGGWQMPIHDVSGHWMCAERGKARPGCRHDPRLRDGDHAICGNCGNLIVWVPEHQRGDPNIQRRTTYRVIP